MPASFERKIQALTMKVLPISLYGVPATPLPKRELQVLRTEMAKVLDPGAARNRCVASLLGSCHPKVVDPAAHILMLRAMAIRRA
eukprot:541959-Alexandrium_andersonii.AAC.1